MSRDARRLARRAAALAAAAALGSLASFASLASLGSLVTGCAAAAPPPPTAAAPPPQAPAAADPWQTATLPVEGIAVAMPGEPDEIREVGSLDEVGEIEMHGLQLERVGEETQAYAVWRTRSAGSWPDKLLDDAGLQRLARAAMDEVDTDAPAAHQGFVGRALAGRSGVRGVRGAERQVLARAFAVGGCAYVLRVDAPRGGLDLRDAERFFGSFALTVPWRIFAWPEARLTAAVPATAAEEVFSDEGPVPLSMRIFHVGGEHDTTYTAAFVPVPADRLRGTTPEQLLDEGARRVGEKGEARVERITPITHAGVPGRDILSRRQDGWLMRTRLLLAGDRLYMLIIAASSGEPLEDEHAARFLGSLQIGRAP